MGYRNDGYGVRRAVNTRNLRLEQNQAHQRTPFEDQYAAGRNPGMGALQEA